MVRPLSRPWLAAMCQVALAATALIGVVLAPPASGAMLAVPLGGASMGGASMGEAINLALRNGATIEGPGRFTRSIVLRGEYARLAAPLRSRGIVLLAAPSLRCGR